MLDLLHPALLALLVVGLVIRAEHRAVNPAAAELSKALAGQESAYHARLANSHHKLPQLVLFARSAPTKAPEGPQEPAYHAWLANIHPPKQSQYVLYARSVPTKAPAG